MSRFCPSAVLIIVLALQGWFSSNAYGSVPCPLPDTGQTTSYTATPGEDGDFILNPPAYVDNHDGTITDSVTGLMWQQTDGGEMTFAEAALYCDYLTLARHYDWRLPTGRELFSLNLYDRVNPALDTDCFTKTAAQYWWSSDIAVDNTSRVWVVNAGGGIGPHPQTESKSAGGSKLIHVRAVRCPAPASLPAARFLDQGDGTIADQQTGLIWQQVRSATAMTWEEALRYSKGSALAGWSDWRVPNIRELQSLNDVTRCQPSVDSASFTAMIVGNYWSSTTQQNAPERAWHLNTEYGIVSYSDKTAKQYLLLVRGGAESSEMVPLEALIPAGDFVMGDHFGFVDPAHPSDEGPLHSVRLDAYYLAKTETTNRQYLAFLNMALDAKEIEVRDKMVFRTGTADLLCYTHEYADYYSISYAGSAFTIADFRADHPMVGVMWPGAAVFCNWLSRQMGLPECYNPLDWSCDFTRTGYRLPTEAEWEYAGRGGNLNPYLIYPRGNTIERNRTNLPDSGDPYESGSYPHTTPAGFYDGGLKQKSTFNWPGTAESYQTGDGANGFGLYDMQGNVWELVNDWYGQSYYKTSPIDNPHGPDSGFIMPDGKPYRGMRGGNWYNGLVTNGVNDGHSRVANRNPSYYRGPQDPNHPWYHIGFRVARNAGNTQTSILSPDQDETPKQLPLQNYPNPFNAVTTLQWQQKVPGQVTLHIYNVRGEISARLVEGWREAGPQRAEWRAEGCPSGLYFGRLELNGQIMVKRMLLLK